jgi:hypothetical protein
VARPCQGKLSSNGIKLRHETTHMTRNEIHCREPRITNAVIERIVFWAPSWHWSLGADAVVLF